MFKSYVLGLLTQSSTWIGVAIIIADLTMPRTFILFLGILLLFNDDSRLQKFFATLTANIKSWWQ